MFTRKYKFLHHILHASQSNSLIFKMKFPHSSTENIFSQILVINLVVCSSIATYYQYLQQLSLMSEEVVEVFRIPYVIGLINYCRIMVVRDVEFFHNLLLFLTKLCVYIYILHKHEYIRLYQPPNTLSKAIKYFDECPNVVRDTENDNFRNLV